jgi:hypothetical protein
MALDATLFVIEAKKARRTKHATATLTQVSEPCLSTLHVKRMQSLLRATAGLLHGGIASLSAIALSLSGASKLKHRLKSVDRLLGNGALHQVRGEIYRRNNRVRPCLLPRKTTGTALSHSRSRTDPTVVHVRFQAFFCRTRPAGIRVLFRKCRVIRIAFS